MEKLSIVDLKEICGRAWDVPACEVALLLNPQSTEVVHTRGTSVRLLVSQRHDVLCGPNPARLIVEGALKELEESVPLRRGAAEDLRRQLAAQQLADAQGEVAKLTRSVQGHKAYTARLIQRARDGGLELGAFTAREPTDVAEGDGLEPGDVVAVPAVDPAAQGGV